MTVCIVCNTETSKYRCPKCMERYCSVACCRAHKDLCSEKPSEASSVPISSLPEQTEKPCFEQEIHPAFRGALTLETDEVPPSLLQKLGQNSDIRSQLYNPHLRAVMENLVNTDQPDLAMGAAMREPIFAEFADACLRVVDQNNPNLEAEAEDMDILHEEDDR